MRKGWLWGVAGASGLGLAAYWYAHSAERVRVSLHRATVTVDKQGLPDTGLTILHLSDFHFRAHDSVQAARLEKLRGLLAAEQYDVIALTGDLIHNEAGLPTALSFLDELHPRVAAFWVPGNRDYWESSFRALLGGPGERRGLTAFGRGRLALCRSLRLLGMFAGNERTSLKLHRNDVDAINRSLEARGFQPLINRAAHLQGPDYDLWFAGVDDLNQGRPDVAAALEAVPHGVPLVLLSHNPDIWLGSSPERSGKPRPDAASPETRRADLVLSGHTHGGQLNIPLVGAWYRQGTLVSRHKAAGWFEDGTSRMYVTRGLGESFPFRLGAPPQAAVIRLAPGAVRQEQVESRRSVREE